MDVGSVLAQIRALRAQASASAAPAANAAQPVAAGNGFASMLKNAIGEVNRTQQVTETLRTSFSQGDPSVELSDVMLAAARSQVNFRAMSEVRNRLVAAYQDVMNMPV